ncbi:MAG: hypothetical protein OMM_06784, partial [Candidatus Magnetoglobus multicellularis str. Araruama]
MFSIGSTWANEPAWTPKTGQQYSMVAYGKIYQNDAETDWTDQYIIAAFGPGGEADCRAMKDVGDTGGSTNPGMYYLTITSDTEEEQITFKIWDKNGQKALNINQSITFKNQDTLTNFRLDVVGGIGVTAKIAASQTSGVLPLTVNFDSNASTGNISAYTWDFGDQSGTSTDPNPSYTYQTEGEFTVTLTVSGDGDTDSATTQITVSAVESPTASFTATPTSGDAPLLVTFDSSPSTGDITDYSWNFGDQSSASTDSNPSHTFEKSGTYTVTLSVTGPGGTDSFVSTITANDPSQELPNWTPKTGQ